MTRHQEYSKRLNLNAAFGIGLRGLSMVGSLLTTWLLARFVSVEYLGSFAFALLTVQIASVISTMGVDGLLFRLLMKREVTGRGSSKDLVDDAYATILSISVGVALLLLGISLAVSLFGAETTDLAICLAILACTVPFFSLGRVYIAALRSAGRMTAAQAFDGLFPTFATALALAALKLTGGPLRIAPALLLCGWLVNFLVARQTSALRVTHLWRSLRRFWFGRKRALLKTAFPQQQASIINYLCEWLPALFITVFLGRSEVGLYRVLSQMVNPLAAIVLAIEAPTSAAIGACYHAHDEARSKLLFERSRIMMILWSFPPLILLLLFGGMIVNDVFHIDDAMTLPCLGLLLAGQAANALTGPVGAVLAVIGPSSALQRNSNVATLSLALLLIVFGPMFGLFGVALVAAITSIIRNGLNTASVYTRLGIPFPAENLARRSGSPVGGNHEAF